MEKKLLIDAAHPEETRVVVAESSQTHDFDFESNEKAQITGNIYLAKVTRVEPSLQAAFLDYGGNRHGFLAFSEIQPFAGLNSKPSISSAYDTSVCITNSRSGIIILALESK